MTKTHKICRTDVYNKQAIRDAAWDVLAMGYERRREEVGREVIEFIETHAKDNHATITITEEQEDPWTLKEDPFMGDVVIKLTALIEYEPAYPEEKEAQE